MLSIRFQAIFNELGHYCHANSRKKKCKIVERMIFVDLVPIQGSYGERLPKIKSLEEIISPFTTYLIREMRWLLCLFRMTNISHSTACMNALNTTISKYKYFLGLVDSEGQIDKKTR